MSRDALIQFFARLGQEPELQDQLVEFAAKHGFEFSADELTDADLEKLAGGPTRRGPDFSLLLPTDQLKLP